MTAAPVKTADSKSHNTALGVPIADKTSAAASKSTIDINANPVYAPAGKPITQVSIDEGPFLPLPPPFTVYHKSYT